MRHRTTKRRKTCKRNAANLRILDEASEIHRPDGKQEHQDVRSKNSAKYYKGI